MHGHKLKTARFTNNQRSAIVAEWIDLKTDAVRENVISVSERNNQFKYLMTLTNLDKIEKNTIEYGKRQTAFIKEYYKNVVERGYKDRTQTIDGALVYEDILNFIFKFDPEKDDEILFDLKLGIFDMEEITMNESQTELKESIRTAKTPIELIYLLAESGLFPNMPRKTTPKKKRAPKKTKTVVDSSPDSEQI
tara:strand:+ start:315 stop:893 length:579 start_codon:yes stop_codon:yes gene_type:complete